MNNQITVIDKNNQSINVELISYFKNNANNKKYLFFTKNELVQDGLIKMYVVEESNGLITDISDVEWNELKGIMQGIIKNSTLNISYFDNNAPVKIGNERVIALDNNNLNVLKSKYSSSNKVSETTVSNADMLNQSFSTPVLETPQINSIPNIDNKANLEETPVNLGFRMPQESDLNPVSVDAKEVPEKNYFEQPKENDLVEAVPQVTPLPEASNDLNIPSLDEVQTNIKGGIESGFKVTNEPNIFDQPITPEIVSPVVEPIAKPEENIPNSDTTIDEDLISLEISLEESNIKLYEGLAENSRKRIELLKRKYGKTNNDSLENTASDLFNNNGSLNESKVLGKY